jgi:hypothetical protein
MAGEIQMLASLIEIAGVINFIIFANNLKSVLLQNL